MVSCVLAIVSHSDVTSNSGWGPKRASTPSSLFEVVLQVR